MWVTHATAWAPTPGDQQPTSRGSSRADKACVRSCRVRPAGVHTVAESGLAPSMCGEAGEELQPNTTSNVMGVTADFAMQNVMLQVRTGEARGWCACSGRVWMNPVL
jgi:hypothetical protein